MTIRRCCFVALLVAGFNAQAASPGIGSYLQTPLAFDRQGENFTAHGRGYVIGVKDGRARIGVANHTVTLDFAGSRPAPAVAGPELPGKVNYIYGNDRRKWRTGLPTYGRVTYPNVYPGVDITYYGNQQQIEFDVIVKPGADPSAIRLKVGGGGKLSLDPSGRVRIADGLSLDLPKIYQEVNGTRKSVSGHYALASRNEVAFRVDSYDRTRPLVVDPTLVYSTYLGGSTSTAWGYAVALDSSQNIFLAGYTSDQAFPVVNAAYPGLAGYTNGFVTKLDPTGTMVLFSTYIGGSLDDELTSIAVDANGNAWAAGYSNSNNFPLVNPIQATFAGAPNDAVVTKFSSTGVPLFSTYLGGSSNDEAFGVAVDSSSNAYVTGYTNSANFPTTGGVIQTAHQGGNDIFVAKFNSNTTPGLVYSTYLGGTGNDAGYAVAADASGNAYVTGNTTSTAFIPALPAGGAQTTNAGPGDAFVAKVNPTGTALVYFTFLGKGSETGYAIVLDSMNNATIGGQTGSTGLATAGAAQTTPGGGIDGFVANLNAAGTMFNWFTYLGGNRVDTVRSLALDGMANVYVTGGTDSTNLATVAALQPTITGNTDSLLQSTNSAAAWSVFDSNIPGEVLDISPDPVTAGTIVVASQQGVFLTTNNGASWTPEISSNFGALYLARSPVTSTTIYLAQGNGTVRLSTDNGVTWTNAGSVGVSVAGIVADPLNAGAAYAFGVGGFGVYATSNSGATWKSVNTGLPSNPNVVAMTAASDGTLYLALNIFQGIYKSTNQGGSWTQAVTGLPTQIVADPHALSASGTTVFLALGNIYETTTGGATWTATPGTLTSLAGTGGGAGVITAVPQSALVLYAGTYNSTILASIDGGTTWSAAGTGFPAYPYAPLEIVVDPLDDTHVFGVTGDDTVAFVGKLNSAGSSFTYLTYLGGDFSGYGVTGYGIATDGMGDAFVTGFVFGAVNSFPTTANAIDNTNNNTAAFLAEISDSTAACSYSFGGSGSVFVGPGGGSGKGGVLAPSGCAWTVSSSQSWLTTPGGDSGTGTELFNFAIAPNTTGMTRTATAFINGVAAATITQLGTSCSYSVDKSSYTISAAGGAVSAVLTTGTGCPWTVQNYYPFAISTTTPSGTGSGTVSFTVTPNPSLFTRNFSLPVGTTQVNINQTSQQSQTINFGPLSNQGLSSSPPPLSATASSGLGVMFVSDTPLVCTLSGAHITLVATGTCMITASQPGNAFYAAAPTVTQSFTVSTTDPPPTFANGSNLGTWHLGTDWIALGANSGNGTYTWSLVSGTLPPGLALRTDVPSFFAANQQAGLIGVATTPGTYDFTLSVTSGGQTATQAFTLRVSGLDLQDATPPDAFVGNAFSYTFTPIANAGAVTFTVNSNSTNGAMPPGLSLSSAGVLSGTPTTAGQYEIAMNIFDGVDTQYEQYTLYVYAVDITTSGTLPNGMQSSSYSAAIAASGGSGSYTFSLQGALPSGLTLAPGGTISGTITAGPGLYGFTVTATDTSSASYSKNMAIDVVASPVAPMRITGLTPDDPVLGDHYGFVQSVCCGGTAPFTWTVTGLPPGLTTEPNSNSYLQYGSTPGGVQIYGVPQQAGTFNVQYTVTDATGASTSLTVPMNVSLLDVNLPNTYSAYNLPGGTIGVAYSATFRVLGGTGPYGFSQTVNGELPYGLIVNPAALSVTGTPLENGSNFSPGFQFTDANGNTLFRYENISISGGTSTIGINGDGFFGYDLGTTPVGVAYSTQFSASGASSFVWSVAAGSTLPPGLSLSASGQLSGTPTTPGNYAFLIDAASSTNSANVGVKSFVLTVTPISITTSSLPYGIVGTSYSASLEATGGASTLTWAQIFPQGSQLPPGLTLAANGIISGTPTSAGSYNLIVLAADTSYNIAIRSYTIDVYVTSPPLNLPLGPNLGNYAMGANQLQIQLAATGGTPPYHYSLTPSTPAILGLNVQDGQPLPTQFPASVTGGLLGLLGPGSYSTSVRVTDSTGATFDKALNFNVLPIDIVSFGTLPSAVLNTAYTYQLTADGGSGSYIWGLSNNPPAGITINSSTGLLSGTPQSAGTFNFSVTIADAAGGGSISRGVTLTVSPFAITDNPVLPQATAGSAYSYQFNAPNCGTNCTWSVTNILYPGNPPAGLSLSSGGLLSGTSSFGSDDYVFYVQASGSNGTTQKLFTLPVQPAANQRLALTSSLSAASYVQGGGSYAVPLIASGGMPPYTVTLASGTLPPGMSLQGPGETIGASLWPGFTYFAGRPTTPGTYNFTLQVTDSASSQVSVPYSVQVAIIEIDPAYTTLPLSNNPLIENTPYSQPMLAIGGTGKYTSWATSGSIYPGLSVNPTTGLISGTPTVAGPNVTLWTVTDSAANTVSSFVTINGAGENQTITFAALSDVPETTAPFGLTATASSGLAVTYVSNTPSVCTVSGSTVTIVESGGCSITANQAGNTTYAPAAPVTQDFTVLFNDIPPTASYAAAVDLFAQYGITAGCGNDDFCANGDVTRAEMAVFIITSIFRGADFSYSPTPHFADVPASGPGSFGFKFIQAMYELGISAGCGGGNYCPNGSVTREEMAVFIIVARFGTGAGFTYSSTPDFADVPDSGATANFFKFVQRMKQDGITAGCAKAVPPATLPTYCPAGAVTRAQMAVFMMVGLFNQFLPAGTPVITSISPSTLAAGASGTFTITGMNTTFAQGTTTLSPIPGVTIGTITVNSPTSLTVQLTAAANATPRPYTIVAITNSEQAVLPNSLTIQ